MDSKALYFDYMATTPVDDRVIQAMLECMGVDGVFANPASVTHAYGRKALELVENARHNMAKVINCAAEELVVTSGATEANHLALLGAAPMYNRKGKHLITMQTEHAAVLGPMKLLEKQGFDVTYLAPEHDGLLSLERLLDAVRVDTILVSIMHVNNETGVIQDIPSIAKALTGLGILLHVDAAQSIGKLPVDVKIMGADLISFSAHKAYGPKGVGALYIKQKPRVRLLPWMQGGGQERGLRPGTVATHQMIGMSYAWDLAEKLRDQEVPRIRFLRDYLWKNLDGFSWVHLNGSLTQRVAHNLNISIEGVSGDKLLEHLPLLAVSSTSACAAASHQPSYVLKAMGVSQHLALSSIRFSFGRWSTLVEVDQALEYLYDLLPKLRK